MKLGELFLDLVPDAHDHKRARLYGKKYLFCKISLVVIDFGMVFFGEEYSKSKYEKALRIINLLNAIRK